MVYFFIYNSIIQKIIPKKNHLFTTLQYSISTNDKLSNPAGAKVCADQYATLNTCLSSAGESTAQLGLKSKKFHIDRVYGGLGKKSRIKKGAGKAQSETNFFV